MRIVMALGGNALASPDGRVAPDDQRAAVQVAADALADLVAAGHDLLVTHGNGPQVGNLLVTNEIAASEVPPLPLDWCGAETQATIGMLLLDALDDAIAVRRLDRRTAVLVSRTLVDVHDPAFAKPSKPIGRYLSADDAQVLIDHGQQFVEIAGKGWRRVVPSPEPLECLDAAAADTLLAAGYLVVSSGGGGIPTVRDPDGGLRGVEAVIDKDLTAVLIAEHIGADALVIATDVDAAYVGWGTPDAQAISGVTASQMRSIAAGSVFASGSMGPKVEAVTRFAERAGGIGIIARLDAIAAALEGTAGTTVRPG